MNVQSRKVFSCILSVWFAVAGTLGAVANAQSVGSDFEAPIIEHEENVSGRLGDIEVFTATVVDNEEVERVSLFYRYSGEDDFIEISMQQLVQSAVYSARIDTSPRSAQDTAEDSAIEYYIRAEDGAGNVVLKGLSFSPLVRTLTNPAASSASTTASADPDSTAGQTSSPRKINWLYVGLGALLIGGIAAAAGGSGDDNNAPPPPGDCDPNCTITLTLSPP